MKKDIEISIDLTFIAILAFLAVILFLLTEEKKKCWELGGAWVDNTCVGNR